MMLEVEARQELGSFVLDAGFTSDSGVTALFGRSGSGKTSLLRVIAGLERPGRGRLVLDGDVLLDTKRGIFVPAYRRRFGYVFQEGRLFPHLSVRQNLLYGRWFAGRAGAAADFDRIVGLLGISALVGRRPARLSGGEKQRVAIGRALMAAPRLLLMDEPLAALDDERKAEILPYLERLRDEARIPIVYVSHSVAEVARLADRVVALKDGRVEAVGAPGDILASRSVTLTDPREVGTVLAGRVEGVGAGHGLATIALSAGQILLPDAGLETGRPVRLHIPERDVMVATERPNGISALNMLDGVVAGIEPQDGGMARIRIRCGSDEVLARITRLSVERLQLAEGMPVIAIIKTAALAF